MFTHHIGIDYSGASAPTSRLKGLQVYASSDGQLPESITTPAAPEGKGWNWNRKEIAEWLIERARSGERFIAGLDFAFSFPLSYFEEHDLPDWETFLDHFRREWPTDQDYVTVESVRETSDSARNGNILRLAETWTSSVKSVFRFDFQGQVAKSAHAGIPWLARIREAVGDRVHFWPFDGWEIPESKSVIAEVYPAVFKNRYPREGRRPDQQDAYSVTRWLCEADERGILRRYFQPPLTEDERSVAEREGWILGVG